jgi:hypothetical protein
MKTYSTSAAAKMLEVSLITLKRYISDKKIVVPAVTRVGGVRVRLWKKADIDKVRKILPKIANGRKTRHKKAKKTGKKK